jgi:hypothetical protein
MDGVEAEMVEQLGRVVRDDGDLLSRQPGRSSVPGTIEDDQAGVEALVDVLVWVARVPRPGCALEEEDRPPVGRAVLPPGERPPVAERQAAVAHDAKLWR